MSLQTKPELSQWPKGTALKGLGTTELRLAIQDRKRVLEKAKPGLPADMCRYALERLEDELRRRVK